MRLEGFRCDGCGAESKNKPGKTWHEVSSMMLNYGGWSMITKSDGLHYCSKECLKKAIDETWK